MKYRRLLPVKSLSEVENPWTGVTLNRCILVAMVVIVVSSGVELVQETLEPLFEEAEEEAGSELQDGGADESSWWDTLAFWNWGGEDELEKLRKRRAARIRNKEMPTKGLLKERD